MHIRNSKGQTVCTVFGCGVDVEELERFDGYIENDDDSIMRDICSQREFDNLWGNRRVRFALSFSCKEAFFKALGVSWTNSDISWKDIELLFSGPELRECCVHLHGCAEEIVVRDSLRVGEACFVYNDEYVVFQVVLLAEAARAQPRGCRPRGATGPDTPICRPRFCAAPAGGSLLHTLQLGNAGSL